MDQAQVSQHKLSMPHTSRIPLARPSGATNTTHNESSPRQSHLPRPTANTISRPTVRPLDETNSKSAINAGYRQHGIAFGPTTFPTKATTLLPPVDGSDTENTPPFFGTDLSASMRGSEYVSEPLLRSEGEAKERRRHRQSLSQRTVETLSRVSPAPSPARKRSITSTSSSSMGPPSLPTLMTRPTTPSQSATVPGRPVSPVKTPFRPPGNSVSSNEYMPTAMSMESIYTPPRAFLKGARIGAPYPSKSRTTSVAQSVLKSEKQPLSAGRQLVKMKSMHSLRPVASGRTLASRPSLQSMPRISAVPTSWPSRMKQPSLHETSSHASLAKLRSPEDNAIAPTVRTRAPPPNLGVRTRRVSKPTELVGEERTKLGVANNSKSSAALREQIIKAKAGRRSGLQQSALSTVHGQVSSEAREMTDPPPGMEIGLRSLRHKIETAVTSGILNLSALSLKQIPDEVAAMYDFREDSNVSWAEAIDLRKLLIADNELEELPEGLFTDWAPQEMMDDSSKCNQFGGLEMLDAHGNQLLTLPIGLRRLENLHTLNLSKNMISFDCFHVLAHLRNLRELRLASNQLAGTLPVEIGGLSNLQILDISNNALVSLPRSLANLHNLQRLFLSSNKLDQLDLTCIPARALVTLDVSGNLLSGTLADSLNQFSRLQVLDVSNNSLEAICSTGLSLPALHTLSLDRNRVVSLPDLASCARLATLTASENKLSGLPMTTDSLVQLCNIDLSSNNIKTIDDVTVNMETLVTLNLAGNPLREKRYLNMNAAEIRADLHKKSSSTLQEGTRDRDSDKSTTAARFTPHAGVLDLNSQELTQLGPEQVDLSEPIHTIRLSNNHLTTFPVELLTHPQVQHTLRSLDLSHNQRLHSTDYLTQRIHLPALQSLYIVSTGLSTLNSLTTHLTAPHLHDLNISCHRLTGALPPLRPHFPALTTLLASDNWFDTLPLTSVSGLEVLDIRNNEIDFLPPHIGLCGNHTGQPALAGRLRVFECAGNRFRVPRLAVVEKGTVAVLRDLRRMVPSGEVPEEWMGEIQ